MLHVIVNSVEYPLLQLLDEHPVFIVKFPSEDIDIP